MKLLELLNGVDYKVLQGSDEKEINKIQYDSRKTVSYTHLRAHET